MSKIVIINGAPGSGKTTFEEICKEILTEWNYDVNITSTVDFVKKIARECGWDGQKNLETREFLSDLKDLLAHAPWGNVPFNKIMGEVRAAESFYDNFDMNTDKVIFFVDCREPWEIQTFVEEANAITAVVRRDEAENSAVSNHADADVLNFKYDYEINNNFDLEKLRDRANAFCYVLTKI